MTIFERQAYSSEIKNVCSDIANEYGYTVDFHYYDKPSKTNYSGDTKLGSLFSNYNVDDLKFTLSDSKRVKRGVCDYIDTKGEIIFHLALKGHQFLLVCKFTPDVVNTQVKYDEDKYNEALILLLEDKFLSKSNRLMLELIK
jgi:hypothetical protein